MIYLNNSTIKDWNFDNANIIKVYRNGAVCYYKIISSGGATVQTPCYAVVDDISQYLETEFEDVYDKTTEKWYKFNNLNQYEEYGVYGSGRTITYYEGKLTIDDGYEYQYSGNSWVNVGEVSGSTASLPDVPFSVNYNANNYDANTKTLAKTSGQLADVDAVITAGTPTVHDTYLTIAANTRATISGYQTYFNRDNNNPNLTIISKQLTNGSNCHLFANRDSNYNWMYRPYYNRLALHGSSETSIIAVTTQPVIESVRVDSSRNVKYNNYTNDTTSTASQFSYGSTNSGKFVLFAGYANNTGEWFDGDFYWIYMSQNTLTDEQVQQVIAYNEGGGGQVEYPVYYDEKTAPPNNLIFETMAEAEEYECPWVGMRATISGDSYIFSGNSQDGYEWVTPPTPPTPTGTIWLDPPSISGQCGIYNVGFYWGEGYKMVINTYLSGRFSSNASIMDNTPRRHSPIDFVYYSNGFYLDLHDPLSTSSPDVYTGDYSYRIMKNNTLGNYENGQIMNTIITYGTVRVELEETGAAIVTASTSTGGAKNWYNGLYDIDIKIHAPSTTAHLSGIKVYNANDELVNDLKFIKNDGVVGAQEISMYDSVLGVTYNNTTEYTPSYHIVTP